MLRASVGKDSEILSLDWGVGIPGNVVSVLVLFIAISGIKIAASLLQAIQSFFEDRSHPT